MKDISFELVKEPRKTAPGIGFINLDTSIQWPFIYEFLDSLNKKVGSKLSLVSFDSAHNFPFSNDAYAYYNFPTDALVAYTKSGIPFGTEIVQDPYFTMSAFSTEENREIQMEYNSGSAKLLLPAGKFCGAMDVALTVFGLSSEDFRRVGPDVSVEISDTRFCPIKIENGFPRSSDFVPATRDVVYRPSEDYGPFVGPIVVYRSNYDASWSFGYTYTHSVLPYFDRFAVEIKNEDLKKMKKV
ncbi:hypothetical protein EHO60_13160 [Leptospira fletcheri]|uniref:Uncharacterized protein n=1 Tax=Leptospira fletcheri TaxID=2484981 RepID=A0A4R9GB55_9LEPT|nr:hypothetical protein [Leptospira fletcheri]TGK08972.1 hypothetical protein EHO60_13160 [Leptospira fletcheri]